MSKSAVKILTSDKNIADAIAEGMEDEVLKAMTAVLEALSSLEGYERKRILDAVAEFYK